MRLTTNLAIKRCCAVSLVLLGCQATAQTTGQALSTLPSDRLSGAAATEFAERRIIWNDPSIRDVEAFIPLEVMERVPPEDLPFDREDRETLAVQFIFRRDGIGPTGNPYPTCGPSEHFRYKPVAHSAQMTLEEIALDGSPTVIVVKVERQEIGWNTRRGVLKLNEAVVKEILRTAQPVEIGENIRFFTFGGEFTAAGVRFCSDTFTGSHQVEPGDHVMLIGWGGKPNGIFTVDRFFVIDDGVLLLQPYKDIRQNRQRTLADFVRSLAEAAIHVEREQ